MNLDEFPSAQRLANLLSAHVGALQEEYDILAANGAFKRQTECLHDPSRGGWSYVAVVGDANPLACTAEATPAACAWVAEARRDVDAPVIVRVGCVFSVSFKSIFSFAFFWLIL